MGIKIDIKQFIRDRIWFGWYWAETQVYNPLALNEDYAWYQSSGWTRIPAFDYRWRIIDRTAAGSRHEK